MPAEASERLRVLAEGEGASVEAGCVIRLDRGYPLVCSASGTYRAEHAISLVKGGDQRACVGDWVVLRLPDGHDKARIEEVLPRRGVLSRWDGRSRGERQVLASHLDLVLVVQPLSARSVTADRAARSAVLACQGGCRVAVVLTKADRARGAGSVEAACTAIRECLGDGVPVVATCAPEGEGVEDVRALVGEGTCALLLGESGAGKSTLVNALLGSEVLGTAEVRDRDDQGRHTTVARRMLKVPGGGVLVDAPGLRSLPLLDEERGRSARLSGHRGAGWRVQVPRLHARQRAGVRRAPGGRERRVATRAVGGVPRAVGGDAREPSLAGPLRQLFYHKLDRPQRRVCRQAHQPSPCAALVSSDIHELR